MRSKSPERMQEILECAEEFCLREGRSPSTQELAGALGLGKSTVYRYLTDMAAQGMLRYDGRRIETARTRKRQGGVVCAPVAGAIVCGAPEQAEEQIEQYVPLPEAIFGRGDFFLLRACGDSMTDAGIAPGDLVVIRRQSSAQPGQIIAALIDGSESTLKTLVGFDPATGETVLRYENRARYGDREIRTRQCAVQGVAQHVIKAL